MGRGGAVMAVSVMLAVMGRLTVPALAVILTLLWCSACGGAAPTPAPTPDPAPADPAPAAPAEPTPADPAAPAPTEARYRVTFTATWSAATHPRNFPRGPHFSGLVGATHGDVRIWQSGKVASGGMEQMAETGGKSRLLGEIDQLIERGSAHARLSGGGLSTSPATVSLEFTAVSSHPFVTLVSMLAPSPDWFVGVSALPLMEDGTWKARAEVALVVYDAGTDDGAVFTAGNADSDPAEPIAALTSDPDDTDFTAGKPAVGTFVFERL